MRIFCVILALLALTVPAIAADLATNGGFDLGEVGWTRWSASWGGGQNYIVQNDGLPAPCLRARFIDGAGSFGWYQRIQAAPNGSYSLSADWLGNFGLAGSWAEVMFFRIRPTVADADIVARIDGGAATDIAFKKDSWGQNLPSSANGQWAWESAALSPATGGNNGLVSTDATRTQLVVALKYGHTDTAGPVTGNVRWDNIVVSGPPVPEPAGILALMTGLVGVAGLVRRGK